jgi:hypothetical protein
MVTLTLKFIKYQWQWTLILPQKRNIKQRLKEFINTQLGSDY